MKRIGVVSDSHGNIMNLQDAVLAMGEVDAIFHLENYMRMLKKSMYGARRRFIGSVAIATWAIRKGLNWPRSK